MDKSLCVNSLCRKRHKCWRYNYIPRSPTQSYWQSYTNFGEECTNNGFKYFIEVEGDNIIEEI